MNPLISKTSCCRHFTVYKYSYSHCLLWFSQQSWEVQEKGCYNQFTNKWGPRVSHSDTARHLFALLLVPWRTPFLILSPCALRGYDNTIHHPEDGGLNHSIRLNLVRANEMQEDFHWLVGKICPLFLLTSCHVLEWSKQRIEMTKKGLVQVKLWIFQS
jgi:hypothetical protein